MLISIIRRRGKRRLNRNRKIPINQSKSDNGPKLSGIFIEGEMSHRLFTIGDLGYDKWRRAPSDVSQDRIQGGGTRETPGNTLLDYYISRCIEWHLQWRLNRKNLLYRVSGKIRGKWNTCICNFHKKLFFITVLDHSKPRITHAEFEYNQKCKNEILSSRSSYQYKFVNSCEKVNHFCSLKFFDIQCAFFYDWIFHVNFWMLCNFCNCQSISTKLWKMAELTIVFTAPEHQLILHLVSKCRPLRLLNTSESTLSRPQFQLVVGILQWISWILE